MERLHTTPEILDKWASFRSQMFGEIVTPDDAQYHLDRLAWNLSVDQYPAVIVKPKHTADMVTAVQFAQKEGLGIAVQSTGHGNVRPADNAMLILTSAMNEVHIDTVARTAWIGAGAKWEPVLKKAQAVGLAPLLGSTPDVGAVGYTLGGGFGWLGRKYGLSADNVNFFEVVTADGRILVVNKEKNNDLFWGLRGGGGSLAIVTGMEVKLVPVTTVYAGNLLYPIEHAKEVFLRYRHWIKGAPEELTSSVLIMNYPPIPEIPEFLQGNSFVHVRGCFCGSVDKGEKMMEYWRAWRIPFLDDFKIISFADVATISNDPLEPMPGLSSGAWVQALTDDFIDTLITYTSAAQNSPVVFAEVRHVGGAVSRVDPKSAAYGNRDANHILQIVGVTPTPQSHQDLQQFFQKMLEALAPALTGGVYLNFLEGVEAQTRIQDGFSPESFQQLRELKTRYDPENRLGYSFNVLPNH